MYHWEDIANEGSAKVIVNWESYGIHPPLEREGSSACFSIRVAEYLVELPPMEMLKAKLHEAMRLARGQVGRGRSE
jgi:hypothetical protein